MRTIHLLSAAAIAAVSLIATPARAAESFDSCNGHYITSLPAVITQQGTWCMSGDLATSITSGSAIDVQTNNVTIDCNDNKLGNLSAGLGTGAYGIRSTKDNVRVRNCQVRGFQYGVWISGDEPAIIDNRFDSQTKTGISVSGNAALIERNVVFNLIGTWSSPTGIAIVNGGGIVRDNVINDIFNGSGSLQTSYGIRAVYSSNTVIANNVIRNIYGNDDTYPVGIHLENLEDAIVQDNLLTFPASTSSSFGIKCSSVATALIDGNRTNGFTYAVDANCTAPTNHVGM